ncbi:MAG TPA: hypothetical protein VK480_09510 [Solirubrobacterales bacterium]|nr:hypothetical protein [Solirubrobacterales bacterium]
MAAAWAGCATSLPASIPDFALRSAVIYRVEVALAAFAGPYLILMALFLALHNRGFSDIGVNGLRAQDMSSASLKAMADKRRLQMGELRRLLTRSNQMVRQLDHRVRRLEADSTR